MGGSGPAAEQRASGNGAGSPYMSNSGVYSPEISAPTLPSAGISIPSGPANQLTEIPSAAEQGAFKDTSGSQPGSPGDQSTSVGTRVHLWQSIQLQP